MVDHRAIQVHEIPAGEPIVLPYHWMDLLRAEPGSVELEPVTAGSDPVPFISVRSPQAGDASICLHPPCDLDVPARDD